MEKKAKKKIGIFSLTSIGVGAIIGSGIFAMPASMGAVAGPGLVLAILLAGMIAMVFALVYAELGATFHIDGGPYAFPRLAMGDLTGFLMGWGYFLYLFIGTAAIIDIFIVYLGFYFPSLAHGETLTGLGVIISVICVWAFTIINIYGVQWGSLYSVITTIGKIVPLILFCVIGFFYFNPSNNFVPFLPFGLKGVTIAVTLFLWSYTGFEAIVIPTGEMKNPARTIPVSMILTMVIVSVVYLLIAYVFVGIINWENLGFTVNDWKSIATLKSPLADISVASGLKVLATIVTVGAIISTGGAGGSWILIQGRLPYAMAKDNLFWNLMGKEHPKYFTPANSLIFTSALTTLILVSITHFPSVALIASITCVVPYAAACVSLSILRHTHKREKRPFKVPFHFAFTGAGFILSTFLIYWASWPWTLVGAVLILLGYPAFLLIGKKREDWHKSLWVPVYLIGLVIISILGDKQFEFNNFTPIHPLNIIRMPYDLVVLSIFAIVIYIWIFKINVAKSKFWKK